VLYSSADDVPAELETVPATLETMEDYQRHMVEMHDFDPDDEGLFPWCMDCREPVMIPGQDCTEGTSCAPDIQDLIAYHADVHDDDECYPPHQH
jgi:hypothetical protein